LLRHLGASRTIEIGERIPIVHPLKRGKFLSSFDEILKFVKAGHGSFSFFEFFLFVTCSCKKVYHKSLMFPKSPKDVRVERAFEKIYFRRDKYL
jgi:hypothetical protein